MREANKLGESIFIITIHRHNVVLSYCLPTSRFPNSPKEIESTGRQLLQSLTIGRMVLPRKFAAFYLGDPMDK